MQKVIIVGDVQGDFEAIFKKIGTINKKHGPFSAAFCVGTFFGRKNDEMMDELKPFIEGSQKIAIPTYFITGDDTNTSLIDNIPNGGEICKNLTFLGRFGIAEIHGMKIGYLSGIYNSESFNTKQNDSNNDDNDNDNDTSNNNEKFSKYYTTYDLKRLDFSKIDIFLTSEWGRGFHYGIANGLNKVNELPKLSKDCASIGSPIVSKLAVKMSPQYHFAGNHDCFYNLMPYINNKTPNVTRFIALAYAISSKSKTKGIYACNVVPLQSLTDEEYLQLSNNNNSNDNTPCPYTLPFKFIDNNNNNSNNSKMKNENESKYGGYDEEPPFKRQRLLSNNNDNNNQNNDEPLKKVYHSGLYGYNKNHPNGNNNNNKFEKSFNNNGINIHRWQTNVPPKDYVCHRCGVSGHFIQDCPTYRNKNNNNNGHNGDNNNNSNHNNNRHYNDNNNNYHNKFRHNNNHNNNNNNNNNYHNNNNGNNSHMPGGSRDDYFFEKYGGRRAMKRAKRSGGECWFCLGSSKVESHMIVSVADHTYVALAKGSLINDHFLLIPINHLQNSQKFTPGVRNEINKYLICLEKCYEKAGKGNKTLLICDRNLPTKYQSSHGYLEIFAIENDKLNGLETTLKKEGEKEGIEFKLIEKDDNLANHIGPFGYIVLHNRSVGTKYVHSVQSSMKKISLNFLRRVVAVHLNLPEKAEWTACIVDKQEETKLTDDLKKLFKPYDWTLRR